MRYEGQALNGACFFEIEETDEEGVAELAVGWSCVIVHRGPVRVSWLSEVIAIATGHEGGVEGFLREHGIGSGGGDGDGSYALEMEPKPPGEEE